MYYHKYCRNLKRISHYIGPKTEVSYFCYLTNDHCAAIPGPELQDFDFKGFRCPYIPKEELFEKTKTEKEKIKSLDYYLEFFNKK